MLISFPIRIAPIAFFVSALTAAPEGIGPFRGPEADAEAARLYRNASDFVQNVVEPDYSYAYMQFYWKRAGSNIDRILRAYPSSPAAAQIGRGELRVGPFDPGYFKERVLPRLEEKKVASFDAINCAIFLYNLESNTDPADREELLAEIVRTLCRQIRWGEALAFPVLDEQRPWLWETVIRQSAIYRNDELTVELLANILPEAKPRLVVAVAEGLAFRGDTPEELEKFLSDHAGTPAARLAALRGLVRREIQIERAIQLRQPLKGLYDGVDGIQKPEQRSDLAAFAAAVSPALATEVDRLLARYRAGIGHWDEARRLASRDAEAAAAYLEYLVLHERYSDAVALAASLGTTENSALLIALARAGRAAEAATVRARLIPTLGAARTEFIEFRGSMLSSEQQLVVRERTFADLALSDPNLTGRLICEWSLTPNRTLRGATPWDAVVFKFAPGFDNLPPPKDKKKVEAAGR